MTARSILVNENELIFKLSDDIDLSMKRVPGGRFIMGSDRKLDKEMEDREGPIHVVTLDDFWIGKYPVTNLQYRVFIESTEREAPEYWEDGKLPVGKGQHPVTGVKYFNALAFCEWLSALLGVNIVLPTEAEWEKAARGTNGRIWPWGNTPPNMSLCNFNSKMDDTTPVGRYSPAGDSHYGCADMSGNVWEWTANVLRPYPFVNELLPEDADISAPHVLRGGAFFVFRWLTRCAVRATEIPGPFWWEGIGFRVASSPRRQKTETDTPPQPAQSGE
jgi:formylglycine-generating enzyme required for sulfatase activity